MFKIWKAWSARRRERLLHNDRDYECKYWWGDRGGYNLKTERCAICNPVKPPPPAPDDRYYDDWDDGYGPNSIFGMG